MSAAAEIKPHRGLLGWAVVLLVGLVWWWSALSYVRGISATFDEPLHVAAGARAMVGDFSVNPEHPPLMKYLAGLGNTAVVGPAPAEVFQDPTAEWGWAVRSLYGLSVTGDSAVQSARFVMSLVGMAVVISLVGMGYWYGGWMGLVASGLVVGFDPLLRGHGALVTNDGLLALWTIWAAVGVGVWWKRPTVVRAILVAVMVGLAGISKHNGLVLVGLVVVVGVLKILIGRDVRALVGGVLLALLTVGVTVGMIWAAYWFRFAPTSDPAALFDMQAIAARAEAVGGSQWVSKLILMAEAHRLLPQSYLAGLLHSYGVTRFNSAFAAGEYYSDGRWWYFPYAGAMKEPIGSILFVGFGLLFAGRRVGIGICVLCIGVAASLMTSRLNIGLRHALPLMGVLMVMAIQGRGHGKWLWRVAVVWGVLTAAEVVWMNHQRPGGDGIGWFNIIATQREPLSLLGDSNVDWGQGLPGLAAWQKEHPAEKLYLAYFGTADPRSYGLAYTALQGPGAYEFGPAAEKASGPGVIAVSATVLQGIYATPGGVPAFYARLAAQKPLMVIGGEGGAIYLYRWEGEGDSARVFGR